MKYDPDNTPNKSTDSRRYFAEETPDYLPKTIGYGSYSEFAETVRNLKEQHTHTTSEIQNKSKTTGVSHYR